MVDLVDFKEKLLFEEPNAIPTYGTVASNGLSWSDISTAAKKGSSIPMRSWLCSPPFARSSSSLTVWWTSSVH